MQTFVSSTFWNEPFRLPLTSLQPSFVLTDCQKHLNGRWVRFLCLRSCYEDPFLVTTSRTRSRKKTVSNRVQSWKAKCSPTRKILPKHSKRNTYGIKHNGKKKKCHKNSQNQTEDNIKRVSTVLCECLHLVLPHNTDGFFLPFFKCPILHVFWFLSFPPSCCCFSKNTFFCFISFVFS